MFGFGQGCQVANVGGGAADDAVALAVEAAVCAGSDADVVAVEPVVEVVPAFAARESVVAGLVVLVAGLVEAFGGPAGDFGDEVGISFDHGARRDASGERGAVLDGQGVARDVLGSPRGDAVERVAPGLDRLVREAVDEVEIDVVEAGVADFAERGLGALSAVQTVEKEQLVGVERLDAPSRRG